VSVEARLLAILDASTRPELVAVPKYYGYAPQTDEKTPTPLPLLVMQRTGSNWTTDMCGTRPRPCFVTLNITHVARTNEAARAQAQAARLELIACAEMPRLDGETEDFDPDLRGWAVIQTFTADDDSPDVT
jgi:hypothetical protein